jgi:signal peptidase I
MLLTVIAITALRSAVADWNDVPTGSMKPTILEGDRIVVNKLAYDLKVPYTRWRIVSWDDPERGDIVVLFSPVDGTRLVKRVVGVPGDRIAMDHNRLIVNGEAMEYGPLDPGQIDGMHADDQDRVLARETLGDAEHSVMITPGVNSRSTFRDIQVPDGKYFVMGDNRDQSLDSRYFGFVGRELVVGRATAVAASVDPERRYLPRWSRFFSALD